MRYDLSLQMQQKQSQKQVQCLIMSPQMQQAIGLLQLPSLELSAVIESELEQNPLLELFTEDSGQDFEMELLEDEVAEEVLDYESKPEEELTFEERDFDVLKRLDEEFRDHFSLSGNPYTHQREEAEKLKNYLDHSLRAEKSLFEHLMGQAYETFEDEERRSLAEALIGNFDHAGFLRTPLEEIALLHSCTVAKLQALLRIIQTFEPYGVGALNLQESLLIQLRLQGKQHTFAYRLIETHFDHLLHNKVPTICRSLSCTAEEIRQAVECVIAKLDLQPGTGFTATSPQLIVPDVVIEQEDTSLSVKILDEATPTLRLNTRYLRMLEDPNLTNEEKDFVKQKVLSAKWLLRSLDQRNETIKRIVETLVKWHERFFLDPAGKLVPLTMKTVAEELQIHESTVARAVAHKYLDCPRGVFPLKYFFTNAYTTVEGEAISSKTVREVLKEILDQEDKRKPYSDAALSALLKERGIPCARRTVAKYRTEMLLGNAQQRRQY